MKSTLQYAYSISVLVGVLVTAYLMMSRTDNIGLPFRSQTPSFKMEAQVSDPAVSRLLEMESTFNELSRREKKPDRRNPADIPQLYELPAKKPAQ